MTKQNYTSRPSICWGTLIITLLAIAVEVALVVLWQRAANGLMAGADIRIGLLAAYGWLVWLCTAVLGSIILFVEKFLPSYESAKEYDERLVRNPESVRKNACWSEVAKAAESYQRFSEMQSEIEF